VNEIGWPALARCYDALGLNMSIKSAGRFNRDGVTEAGSGANLKRLPPGGNSWDDKTDLGTRSLQGSAFRPRNHHPMHQVVPDVQAPVTSSR
jgi:hypothetical protein